MNVTGLSPIAGARNVLRNLEQYGVAAPRELTAALKRAEEHTAAADSISPSASEISAAVITALDTGADPATDANVQRLVIGSMLANVRENVQQQVQAQTQETLRDLADDIFGRLQKAFEQTVQKLRKTHAVLGDIDLEAHSAILAQGGNVADAWLEATKANNRATGLITTWRSVANAVGVQVPDKNTFVFLDPTLEQYTSRSQTLPTDAWTAIVQDVKLGLSDRVEWAARSERIQAEHASNQELSRPPRRGALTVSGQEQFRQWARALFTPDDEAAAAPARQEEQPAEGDTGTMRDLARAIMRDRKEH